MDAIKVLLIEDDPEDAEIVSDLLQSSQLNVNLEVANSSKLGIEKLENQDYHCVLVDHMIPGISGMNLIMKVKETGSSVPCILLTGFGDEEQKQEMLSLGAFDYLRKQDLNREALENKIHKALIWNYKKNDVAAS